MFLKKTAEPFCVAFIRSLALMWPNICVNFGGKSAKSSLHLSFHNQKSIGNKYTVSLLLFYKLGDNWLYLMGESTPGSRLLLDTQLPSYLATFAYKMDSCISTFLEANLEWKNSHSQYFQHVLSWVINMGRSFSVSYSGENYGEHYTGKMGGLSATLRR